MNVALLVVSMLFSSSPAEEKVSKFENAELTTKTWDHFNAKEYAKAIEVAEKCIGKFHDTAKSMNAKLVKEKTPKPPRTQVAEGSNEFLEVAIRGPLNDVATCLWIKARSCEELGRFKEAAESYKQAGELEYAACWDPPPHGWFWFPPEDARERLKTLLEKRPEAKGQEESHEALTQKAWKFFNAGQYDEAMKAADECVDGSYETAKETNQKLLKENAPKPPRTPLKEGSKEFLEVASRGPLNDVATCLWIKGRCCEERRRKEEAKEAFKKGSELGPYGSCWDPKGWFWFPPEDAAKRLKRL